MAPLRLHSLLSNHCQHFEPVLVVFCLLCLGQKRKKADFSFSNAAGDKFLEKSKFNLALRVSVIKAFEDNITEDIIKIIKSGVGMIDHDDLIKALTKNSQILEDPLIQHKLWHFTDFNPKVMEMILLKNPELFVDEIEDFIISKLENPLEFPTHDMPKFLALCCHSAKAFQILCDVLVYYVFETDFDTKMVALVQKIVTKIHQTSPNPILIYPPRLQPLILLLLTDPKADHVNVVGDRFLKLNSNDVKLISVIFLPWLKMLLNNDPTFHLLFFPLFRI